jgi:hypothetical protein
MSKATQEQYQKLSTTATRAASLGKKIAEFANWCSTNMKI